MKTCELGRARLGLTPLGVLLLLVACRGPEPDDFAGGAAALGADETAAFAAAESIVDPFERRQALQEVGNVLVADREFVVGPVELDEGALIEATAEIEERNRDVRLEMRRRFVAHEEEVAEAMRSLPRWRAGEAQLERDRQLRRDLAGTDFILADSEEGR